MHGHPRYGGRVGLVTAFVSATQALVPVFITATIAVSSASADAQTTPRNRTAQAQDAYLAVVTRDDVLVRSGAHDDYYPFGRLKQGRLVKVVGQKNMWARVPAVGEAFDDLYGYVRYRKDDSNRLRLTGNGRTATTISAVDILAPNLNTDARASESWKVLAKIDPNTALQILETFEADGEIVHKVPLPPTATGWINSTHLRPANRAEIARWSEDPAGRTARRGTTTNGPADRAAANRGTSNRGSANPVLGRTERSIPDETGPPFDPNQTRPQVQPARQTPGQTPGQTNRAANSSSNRTPGHTTGQNRGGSAPQQPVGTSTPPVRTPIIQTPPQQPVRIPVAPMRSRLQVELDDLEQAHRKLRAQPETAEVGALRSLYLDLAQRSTERPVIARYAEQRAEQLQIWAELQDQKRELDKLRGRIDVESAATEATRMAIERGSDYVAVGQLQASSIYDGKRLPMLLRIHDPIANRTVAYIHPNDTTAPIQHDLMGRIGQIVGIVGTRAYDGTLRLNVVTPERIDTLATADLVRPTRPALRNDEPQAEPAEVQPEPGITEAK